MPEKEFAQTPRDVSAADLLARIREARTLADEALKKAAEALAEGESLRNELG